MVGLRTPGSRDAFPESLQVGRAERAVVESVAGSARLTPDHASVIGPHRTVETRVVKRREHRVHVDVAESRGVRSLLKLSLPRPLHIAAVREMNTLARAEPRHDFR